MSTYQKGVKEGILIAAMILENPHRWIGEFNLYEDEIKALLKARDTLLDQKKTKPGK